MSNLMRALLAQADTIEPISEPPGRYGEPPGEGDTVIGTVPRDVRQILSLAKQLADRCVELASDYDQTKDPGSSTLGEIYKLNARISMLEACAESTIVDLFTRQVGCVGELFISAGWLVTWNPIEYDCECGSDDEGPEGEAAEVAIPHKRILSS